MILGRISSSLEAKTLARILYDMYLGTCPVSNFLWDSYLPMGINFMSPPLITWPRDFSLLIFWMEELIYDIEMGLSRNNASSSGMMVLILSRFKFIFLDHHLLTKKIDSKIRKKFLLYIYITRGGYFFLYIKRQYFLTCGLPFCKGNKHLGYPYRKIGNK